MLIREILDCLEDRSPSSAAEAWDNVGLLAGDPSWKTSGAVVSIDLSERAILEARRRGARLIVNHHPCIFPRRNGIAGLARVVPGAGRSGLVFEALRHGIAIVACHTNFDRCALEVVDRVSTALGVRPRGRLIEKPAGSLVKLAVFVPVTHAEAVRAAICEAGAGQIGDYDGCSFGVAGEGTFRGSQSTRPFVGKPGQLERAREIRLETVIPRGLESRVLRAMREAHPYEEVAYDLYPLEQVPPAIGIVKGLGYGFWGEFGEPRLFSEVLRDVRRVFHLEGFLLTRPFRPKIPRKAQAKIRRVAFAPGKGASVVAVAAQLGCELMITGEAGYHEALAASRSGLATMELGHRESERFFVPTMKAWLEKAGLRAAGLQEPAREIFRVRASRQKSNVGQD